MKKEIRKVEISDKRPFIQEFYNIYHKRSFYLIGIDYKEVISYSFPFLFSKDENSRRIFLPIIFANKETAEELISNNFEYLRAATYIYIQSRRLDTKYISIYDLLHHLPILQNVYGLDEGAYLSLWVEKEGESQQFNYSWYNELCKDMPNKTEFCRLVGYDWSWESILESLEYASNGFLICCGYSAPIKPNFLDKKKEEKVKTVSISPDEVLSHRKIYYKP